MRDLEPVTLSGGTVEEEFVVAHRLTGPLGIDAAIVAANLVWHQAAAGFEMALHADFQLPLPAETCRVDDHLPYLFPWSIRRKSRTYVFATRPMTPLAINSLRNRVGEKRKTRVAALGITALQRQAIVAQQALAGDGATKVLLVRSIITRAHRPITGVLYVPGDRQFDQPAIGAAVQIAAGVVAGANDVVDLFLGNVCLLAVEALLRPALIKPAVVLHHCVAQARRGVVDDVVGLVVLDGVRRRWPVEKG